MGKKERGSNGKFLWMDVGVLSVGTDASGDSEGFHGENPLCRNLCPLAGDSGAVYDTGKCDFYTLKCGKCIFSGCILLEQGLIIG